MNPKPFLFLTALALAGRCTDLDSLRSTAVSAAGVSIGPFPR